jgi:hypothetical protein
VIDTVYPLKQRASAGFVGDVERNRARTAAEFRLR